MNKQYFLDANAHIPINSVALQEYVNFNGSLAGHGHALSHSFTGREAARLLEEARAKIAAAINCKGSGRIIFTSGCTQACEWGIKILSSLNKDKESYTFAYSPIEHPAVYMAIDEIIGIDSKYSKIEKLRVSFEGATILPDKYTSPYDSLVCVSLQNEIGSYQPIYDLRNYCRYFFSDMSQSLGKESVDIDFLGVDIATFGAHKFGGVPGVGFIYLSNGDYWEAFGSGSRYYLDIPGTPNVAGIYASAIALEEATKTLDERYQRAKSFKEKLEPGLEILGFEIIGKNTYRSAHITFAKIPTSKYYINAITIMDKLAEKGIYIGLGSACGSLYLGGSSLMQALNRPSDGQDYIRISQFGEYDDKDANYVLKCIEAIL